MNDQLLTTTQAAQRLGIGALTVAAWVRQDRCPVIRDGRKIRIPGWWVDELLAKGWR